MINLLLKAKHWQLFILTFGIPMIFQIAMMVGMMATFSTESEPDPEIMMSYMKFFPVVMIIFMAVLFSWLWSISVGLQYKVPANAKMKVGKFKVFFTIPIVYITLISIFIGTAMTGMIDSDKSSYFFLFALIIPIHFFSMFCILYCLYFTAKTLKTIEFQREVNFSDFAGEFFMVWFYPIGIWIIQPKINKMVESEQ